MAQNQCFNKPKGILKPEPYGLELDVVMAMSDRQKKQKLRWGREIRFDIYEDGINLKICPIEKSDVSGDKDSQGSKVQGAA